MNFLTNNWSIFVFAWNQVAIAADPIMDIILNQALSSSPLAGLLSGDGGLARFLLRDDDSSDEEFEQDLLMLARQRRSRSKRRLRSLAVALTLMIAIPHEPRNRHPRRISSLSQANHHWRDDMVFLEQFRFKRERFLILTDKLKIPKFIQCRKYVSWISWLFLAFSRSFFDIACSSKMLHLSFSHELIVKLFIDQHYFYYWYDPSRLLDNRYDRLCGRVVFLMLLMRLGNQFKSEGSMESIWGYPTATICKYTNVLQAYIFDNWGHVLKFNQDYVSSNLEHWAERMGNSMQDTDASTSRF